MSHQTARPTQYYGLRLVKLVYKMLCFLTVLVALGGLGYISLQAVNSLAPDASDFARWLPQALGLVIGGGLLALTFYVIAQVIEVQLAMNAKMNLLVKGIQDIPAALQKQEMSNQQVLTAVRQLETAMQTQARAARLQLTTPSQPVQQQTPSSSAPTKPVP